jgi:hypothetical protein
MSERQQEQLRYERGQQLLRDMGILPPKAAPAPAAASPISGATTVPAETSAAESQVVGARNRMNAATQAVNDAERAVEYRRYGITLPAKPALPPDVKRTTQVPIVTMHTDGKAEVRMTEPTDAHDIAALAEYGTTFRSLPDPHRQYVRALVKAEDAYRSAMQGSAGVRLKSDTESDLPLYRSGTLPTGTHIIDVKNDIEVDYIGTKGSQLEKDSKNYRRVSADTFKQWQSIKEMESIFTEFERVAPQLVQQPGLNKLQQLRMWAERQLGIPGAAIQLDALKGATLRVAKAMQGSAQNLSDADRKTVEGMLPTAKDTAASALERLEIAYRILGHMKSSLLGQSRAVDKVRDAVGAPSAPSAPTGAPPGIWEEKKK